MEMKAKDTYRCECRHGVSEEALSTLMTMYQPLVGPDSILIYLTLAAEAQSPHGQDSLQRLFALTGIPADTFEKACARLEEYMLMRTYMKETDTKNSYVFVLSFPLSAHDFIKNAFYMSRYQKVMGQGQAEISAARAVAGTIPVQEYKDVTHVIKNVRTDDYERSVPFIEIKPKFVFSPDDESVNFDYHSFDMKCSTLVFPAELRSGENMDLIGRLAVVHGISVEKMIILVKDCVSLSTMKFDTEKLKIKAARAQGDVKPGKDIYDMSPDFFLSSKQNGAPISFTDSQMIGRLSTDMHFSNEVINIMLDYILHERFHIQVPELFEDLKQGNSILINDGKMRLTVLENDGKEMKCRVEVAGPISSHKGCNVPGVKLSMIAVATIFSEMEDPGTPELVESLINSVTPTCPM